MRSYVLLTLCFLACISFLSASPVSTAEVLAIGQKWWQLANTDLPFLQTKSIQLVEHNGQAAYYIINAEKGGFILISADDSCMPVLGYSDTGSFEYPISSPEVSYWMSQSAEKIVDTINSDLINIETQSLWDDLRNGRFEHWRTTRSIEPLLTTTWDQGSPYNALCPVDASSPAGGHTWAGCGAAAMASVMRYWGYPVHGTGSRSYNNPPYGTLSANFGTTYYNWDNMPATCPTGNLDIPLLMFHCGIALTTSFGPSVSTFQTLNFPTALSQYFGYSLPSYRNRFQYSDATWNAMITANLDEYKPVVYIAAHTSVSHLFILDGYENTDYFHINWCWSGLYDGYYYLDNLNPGGVSYSGGHAAIFDIYPTVAVPIRPSSLTASFASSYLIDLHWQDVASNETGNRIQRKTGAAGNWATLATVSANATSYHDTDIASYTTYYYRVQSYNTLGNSSWSNEAYTITSGIITPVQLQTQYLNDDQVRLSWSSSPNAVLYRIYDSDLPLAPGSPEWSPIAETSNLFYDLVSAFPRRFYYVSALSSFEVPANFVQVLGGTFNNGTSNVTLSSFYIDKFEVTQDSYFYIMGVNPSNFTGDPSRPVEKTTWFNAIEYCNRRSIGEGLIPCYSYSTYGTDPDVWPAGWNTLATNHSNVTCSWTAGGYRLPTEMEWMFAAKGGVSSLGFTYSGSNDLLSVAWYYDNAGSATHTTGTKSANELGIKDMSGNVFEWVWDIYATTYPSGAQTNPHGAITGANRCRRGGAYNSGSSACTVAYRSNTGAMSSLAYLGFRVCRAAP